MKYTTTKCRNCGYATRIHESGVSKLELDMPIQICPACGNLILDTIKTEYEFMLESEREIFSSKNYENKSILGFIFSLFAGLFFLILGFIIGEETTTIPLWIVSAFLFYICIRNRVNYSKISKNKLIEQAIYASLKRTSNKNYVKFLEILYLENKIKRIFNPLKDKESYMKENVNLETLDYYKESMKVFDKFNNDFFNLYNDTSFII